MNKINTFENSLAIVKNALGTPATRKPSIPKDREPKLYQASKKNNLLSELGFQPKAKASDKQLSRLNLWKSMIMMLGSFLERSPNTESWKSADLRKFMTQMEICLELKPGKLDMQEYGNLLLRLDAIAPFKDGELTKDLEAIDQIIQAYGDKLAHDKMAVQAPGSF